ncbi:hypothetical protein GCM10008904_32990 [Paraclostridium ghonii]|uniref:Uncharacterized protein n=1 Tax=Paraclostridium ghonii TaxID=29358 RepID=A0ABU0N4G9_9FIRM|nr:hypothetical protein [Paeniclostridium ghonii]MDQ0558026.1 hypothetical protein [Paeniclostridium ghonii]
MREYEELDKLLKSSLLCEKEPSQYLNENLKTNLRESILKEKEISIWWIPMAISFITGLMFFIGIKLFIDAYLIKIVLQYTSCIFVILNLILTFIGLKYFDLRKGAVINI